MADSEKGDPEIPKIPFSGKEIDESMLKPGDHIYAYRSYSGIPYQHHGIYVGTNEAGEHMVIHSWTKKEGEGGKRDGQIRKTTLDEFLAGGKLYRVVYDADLFELLTRAPGSTQMKSSLPAETVVKNAEKIASSPGKWPDYSLVMNNCEQFCVYCKTGQKINCVTNPGQAQAVIGISAAVGVATLYGLYKAIWGGDSKKKKEEEEKREGDKTDQS